MTTSRFASVLALVLAIGPFGAGCDLTVEGDDADTELVDDTTSAVSGRPYFEVWKGSNSRYYFHLVAGNHETILSSQSYQTRTASLGGVLSVLDNAGTARRYDVRQAASGDFYFNLKAANGKVIGTSEMYANKANAERGVDAVVRNVDDYLAFQATRTGARFEVRESASGQFFFNLRAANGAIVLQSESYTSEAGALNGTFSVSDNGTDETRYDLLPSSSGGYYFNLKASNGQVIGTSEVYASKYNAERGRDAIIALLPDVELL